VLDINGINEEDVAAGKREENNASFLMNDSFIAFDGFEIRPSGLVNSPTTGGVRKMMNSGARERIHNVHNVSASAAADMVPLAVLGRGASGIVRKALHVPTLTLVALKEISVFDEEKRRQMVRELKTLYSNLTPLSGSNGNSGAAHHHGGERNVGAGDARACTHIVSMYDAFMDKKEQTVTLVVEYMDGGSLQDIVETGGCDAEPVLANICKRVLKGLAFLHDAKKLHRDIKPANLLINHHGNVKISDLGIVRDLEDDATAAETFTGTYTFMSPERICGKKYSYNSDVWSLGLTVMTVAVGM